MIKVSVEKYCHQCQDFVPDVTQAKRMFGDDANDIILTDTIIQCEHRRRCEAMMRYLIRQAKDEAVG